MKTIIVSVCKNNGIGISNKLPWELSQDMEFFKSQTKNSVVIMGRNTFFSIPEKFRPLKDRTNVVISLTLDTIHGVTVMKSLKEAFDYFCNEEMYIIGGQRIYREALDFADKLLITKIYRDYECDTFFPEICNFQLETFSELKEEKSIKFRFLKYSKIEKHQEYQYLDLLKKVLETGNERQDRTGVGTKSIFGVQMRFDISKEFPLLTTKRVSWNIILKELLWFLKGSTNSKLLEEQNVNIWKGNTSREFLDSRGLNNYPEGDIGANYGFQWRHWGAEYIDMNTNYSGSGIDQLAKVINEIKTNPESRRLIVSAWNVNDLDKMSLNPCHALFQFYVDKEKGSLSCQLYQRSGDLFLGIPFNITSYSALTYIVADLCGLKPGEFIHTIGDAHIYKTHFDQVETQLSRHPKPFCKLLLKSNEYSCIEEYSLKDFEIIEYNSYQSIKAPMAI